MYEYRQVLMRMRLGDTDRSIARSGLMGRRKTSEVRQLTAAAGWLEPDTPLPDDATLAKQFQRQRPVSTVSLVEPQVDQVKQWWSEGIRTL